jgi:hypothetical protein
LNEKCCGNFCCDKDREVCCNNVCCPICIFYQIYGENSEEVELLRKYRDKVLSTTPVGQEIIKLYYLWSPAIVQAMEEDETFKREIKEMVNGILPMIREELE